MSTLFPDSCLNRVIERAVHDDDYRARFLNDPTAILQAAGLPLPEGVEVKVVENTNDIVHLPLPPPPRPGEPWDAALARMTQEMPFGDSVQLALSLMIVHLVRFSKAWSDPAFRDRLARDPNSAMAELDSQVASSIRLEIVQNSDAIFHVTIPPSNVKPL